MPTPNSDVTVINDLGTGTLERRTRQTAKGGTTARYTVTMTSEPILHDWSAVKAAPLTSAAVVEILQRQMRAITASVSPDTEARRARASAELAAGLPSARKRYSGGRMGVMPPGDGRALFNDSGRFAAGITANRTEDGFTVNVPANRLDPSTFRGGEPGIVAMFRRLQQLVPEFAGGRKLLSHAEIQRAVAEDVVDSIFVAGSRSAAAAEKARWRKVQTVLRGVQTVFQMGA